MKPVLFALNQSQKPKRIWTFSRLGGLLLTLALLTTPMLNPRQRAPKWAHAASMRHSVQTLLPTLQGAAAVAYLQQQALYTSLVTAVNVATPAAMSGSTFVQQAYLKASNTERNDNFGAAVAVSGNTVVIGAPVEDSNAIGVNGDEHNNGAENAGAAYVFNRSGTTWRQEAYLKASNPDPYILTSSTGSNPTLLYKVLLPGARWYNLFGSSVAIDKDTLVVGANWEDSNTTGVDGDGNNDAAPLSGATYVFVRSGATWRQQSYLKASNVEAEDQFGWSVTFGGATVVVGAAHERSNAIGINGDQNNNNGGNGIRAIAPTNPNVNSLNQVNISHNTIAHNGQDGITLPGNSPQWQLVPIGNVLTATATDSAVITPGERSSFTSEFSPCYTVAGIINPHLKQVAVTTNYDPATTWPGAPAGTFTIAATFQNISGAPLTELFFKVKSLTNHNRLVDAIGGPGDPVGAGAVQLGVHEVAPGMSFTVTFRIGLTERKPFTFLIDTYGVSAAGYAATAATNATTRFTYTATNEALHDVIEQNNPLYLPLINR